MKTIFLRSFSLVEVLVFVSILSVFFVIAASVATVSLKNMKANEHKLLATHYARQLEDWLRAQKEIGWGGSAWASGTPTTFTEWVTKNAVVNSGVYTTSYCFNTPVINSWPLSTGLCSGLYDGLNPQIFDRSVTLTSYSAAGSSPPYIYQVNADVRVAWQELGQPYNVTTKSEYSILEVVPTLQATLAPTMTPTPTPAATATPTSTPTSTPTPTLTPTSTPACLPSGNFCTLNSQCCSNICKTTTSTCF